MRWKNLFLTFCKREVGKVNILLVKSFHIEWLTNRRQKLSTWLAIYLFYIVHTNSWFERTATDLVLFLEVSLWEIGFDFWNRLINHLRTYSVVFLFYFSLLFLVDIFWMSNSTVVRCVCQIDFVKYVREGFIKVFGWCMNARGLN